MDLKLFSYQAMFYEVEFVRLVRSVERDVAAPRDPVIVFRLDALALSVIATATWLAGWLAGCHTPVLYHLNAPSF